MIDDKSRIKCSKCSTVFKERAERVRNGFQKQCPNCLRLITFDNTSEDSNIRRALKSAREVRQAVADLTLARKDGAVAS
jgi:predicted  nucleic acid-binding Zn-ribbon protein